MRTLIVGAGISGLSCALALEKIGVFPEIIEKSPGFSYEGAGIALPLNAMSSLFHLGLKDEILSVAHTVKTITYALPDGEVLSCGSLLEYPLNQYPFVALPRKDLIHVLSKAIKSPITFKKQIANVNFNNSTKTTKVKFNNNEEKNFDLIIAADGINSSFRFNLTNSETREYLGISTWRFIANYKINDPIYFFGRKSAFMIYPINDHQVYCYGHVADTNNFARKDYLSFVFCEYPATVTWLIQSVNQKDIIFGKLNSISNPIFKLNNVAFIGDASHACSPMLQQGAASAFEDSITLARMIKIFAIDDALQHYENIRKPRIEWIKENSDIPIRKISSYISDKDYKDRNDMLRMNGPINIKKWQTLFSKDYFNILDEYLEKYSHYSIQAKL